LSGGLFTKRPGGLKKFNSAFAFISGDHRKKSIFGVLQDGYQVNVGDYLLRYTINIPIMPQNYQ
jgi:hypothetical protein